MKVNEEFKALKEGNEAPWDVRVTVHEFVTHQKEEYIRFMTPARDASGNIIKDLVDDKSVNIASDFLVKKSDLLKQAGKSHLTPEEIKDLLALPYGARSHYTVVTVPKGVKIRTGIAGPIKDWGNGGVRQYQLATDQYPRQWFAEEVEIVGYFNAAD